MIAGIYLGYDPISNQFQLLCMTSSVDELDQKPNAHHVLTLDSGKRLWRRIEYKFHSEESFLLSDEICINGVLYFGAETGGQSSVIVCFDVRSQKFGFINLDKDMLGEDDGYDVSRGLTLFNYKGKLGIHQEATTYRERDQLVLWVVEDAGNHKWSKHTYELPPLIRESFFVGMSGTGEIVLSPYSYSYGGSKLFYVDLYNLERETFTRINVHGFEELKHPSIRIF